MPIEQIAARLDDRFRLLTGGSRTALPRQQTLRALIDWSYDLLTTTEKALLLRLSVFASDWTLEAAEKVCASEGMEEWEVLDLLTALLDKSLVVYSEEQGSARYRMLETVRQYASDRLLESGEGHAYQVRHLNYFLALAEEAETRLARPEQVLWLHRLEMEHDNLRRALEQCKECPRTDAGLRMSVALWRFGWLHGHFSEGRQWYANILAYSEHAHRTKVGASALARAGALATLQGDNDAARGLFEQSLTIRRGLSDKAGIGNSLNDLGLLAKNEGEYTSARSLFEECVAIRRELGDRAGVGGVLNNLGDTLRFQGDFASARALLEEALAIARSEGNNQTIAQTLPEPGACVLRPGRHYIGPFSAQ